MHSSSGDITFCLPIFLYRHASHACSCLVIHTCTFYTHKQRGPCFLCHKLLSRSSCPPEPCQRPWPLVEALSSACFVGTLYGLNFIHLGPYHPTSACGRLHTIYTIIVNSGRNVKPFTVCDDITRCGNTYMPTQTVCYLTVSVVLY